MLWYTVVYDSTVYYSTLHYTLLASAYTPCHRQAVVRQPVRQPGDHRGERELHPVLQGRPEGVRSLHADLRRSGPCGEEEEDPVLRHADRLEVLRQPDGLRRREVLPGDAHLHAVPLRRGVLRHRQCAARFARRGLDRDCCH